MLFMLFAFAPLIAVFILSLWQDDKEKFKKGVLWILAVSLLLFIGVSLLNYFQNSGFTNEKFGKEYNAIRKVNGLEAIPSNWVLKNPRIKNWSDRFRDIDEDYILRYQNPDSTKNPAWLEKVIWVEGNQVKAESDYYRNNDETLETYYNYLQKYSRKDYFPHGQHRRDYEPREVDSILAAWRNRQ
jgi:hypothetical protein